MFVGLPWRLTRSSALLDGVGSEAGYVVGQLANGCVAKGAG